MSGRKLITTTKTTTTKTKVGGKTETVTSVTTVETSYDDCDRYRVIRTSLFMKSFVSVSLRCKLLISFIYSVQPRLAILVKPRNSLNPGESLENGQKLTSGNGKFTLCMQSDANLVLYSGGTPIWSSRTHGKGLPPYRLVMKEDGNLCIYDGSEVLGYGRCTWASGTIKTGKPAVWATMQGQIKSCED